MERSAVLIGLVLAAYLTQTTMSTGAWAGTVVSSVKCKLQGSTRLPAFSMDGDFVIGGVFSLHTYAHTVYNDYTIIPEPVKCKGRSVLERRE